METSMEEVDRNFHKLPIENVVWKTAKSVPAVLTEVVNNPDGSSVSVRVSAPVPLGKLP